MLCVVRVFCSLVHVTELARLRLGVGTGTSRKLPPIRVKVDRS